MNNPTHRMEILHTDDDFRITRHVSGILWLEHYCPRHYQGDVERWKPMWCDAGARGYRCESCYQRPAHGLQAMFWFLIEGPG